QGYYSSVPETARKFMTEVEWGYWYEGKPAKNDIKDPYGNLREQAGQKRDGGAFWERMGKVACWNTLMDENRYMIRKWNEFIPAFVLTNYSELFGTSLTYALYAKTIKYALTVWAITLVIGFTVSYFLVFHVRTVLWQIALFLLCTVPFWTSNVIRMISWIPFLGRNGLFNQSLMALGLTHRPVEFLLFSDFSVVIAYVHLFSLFMIVPIFNSMARIDRAVIEAAADGGASRFRIITDIVIPLSKTGIALGSIFGIALVMGDFFVVKVMSGGQSASAAGGYWRMAISFDIAATTEALCPPLITFTTKKSPITSAMTKMEPSAMPVFESGITMSVMIRNRLAPPSAAASITARSMRAIELKIGTIMKRENRWT